MKKLFLLLVFPFLILKAEEPLHSGECIISLINYGSSWNVTFTATAIGAKWNENYCLTSDYSSASVTIPTPENPVKYIAYFDLIIDVNAGTNPIMALGKYKISAIEGGIEQAYFYMDWRTSDYVPLSPPDVYFKYDVLNKRFRNSEDTRTIDGTTQTVWDLVSWIDHVTSGLELYLTIINNNSYPKLLFNAYHNPSSVSKYYIYKKKDSPNFVKIAETTSLEYTDYTETIVTGPPIANELLAKYKVSAFLINNQESLEGNEADVRVKGIPMQKANMNRDDKFTNYYLSQNYPNPFNPSTIIGYQLKEDGFVNLRVYNSIGEIVAELVNRKQEQGTYSIEFNASTLPSGVYFYKIQTYKFTDVKKMILLR